jgi:tRNA(fMet)-specific endonuclease VapC
VAVIIADSDVLIDFLRGTQGGAKRFAEEMGKATLTTTAITAFEVRAGAHSAKQKRAIETLLAAMDILPFGAAEAALAAELRQELDRAGTPIGMADYMIAATCLTHRGTLLTRNLKHFARIERLKLAEL